MGDRVAVLKDGVLQQVDTPRKHVRPPGQRVRRRLHRLPGHEPARRCRVEGGVGEVRRRPDPGAARGGRGRRPASATVTVGFRPEDIDARAPTARASTVINVVEELGADAYVYGTRRRQRPGPRRHRPRRRPQAAGEGRDGRTSRPSPGHMHLFSTTTGERAARPDPSHDPTEGAPPVSRAARPRRRPARWGHGPPAAGRAERPRPARPAVGHPAGGVAGRPAGRAAARHLPARRAVRPARRGGRTRSRRSARRPRSASTACCASSTASRCRRVEAVGVVTGRAGRRRRAARGGADHPAPAVLAALPRAVLQTLRPDTATRLLDALAAAARPAAPRGLLLGRLLAVEHAVPPGRRRVRRLPGRRRDRRAARAARPTASASTTSRSPASTSSASCSTSRPAACCTSRSTRSTSRTRSSSATDELWQRAARRRSRSTPASATGSTQRIRRLNDLGFDVAELDDRHRHRRHAPCSSQPKVVDAGHHTRRLLRLTGLDVEENQARRLLNDLDAYRAATDLQGESTRRSSPTTGWPRSSSRSCGRCPRELRGKLEPAEIFHEVLEHRWFLSERRGPRRRPDAGGASLRRRRARPQAGRAGRPRRRRHPATSRRQSSTDAAALTRRPAPTSRPRAVYARLARRRVSRRSAVRRRRDLVERDAGGDPGVERLGRRA